MIVVVITITIIVSIIKCSMKSKSTSIRPGIVISFNLQEDQPLAQWWFPPKVIRNKGGGKLTISTASLPQVERGQTKPCSSLYHSSVQA